MSIIPFTVNEVAGTSVADIDASATINTNLGGADYHFAGVVASQSGEPFKAAVVNSKNISSLLGPALHPRNGYSAMALRHVKECVSAAAGVVVPVVGTDARRPIIALKSDAVNTNPNVAVARVEPFNSDILLEAGELCAIYPVDGDVTARTLSLEPIASKAGFFTIRLVKHYPNGAEDIQLERMVSFDPEAVDEFGLSAYIEDVLQGGNRLNIVIDDTAATSLFVSLSGVQFTGGTRGDLNNIELAEYQKAVAVLRNDDNQYKAVLDLGIEEPTIIKELYGIARDRRIDGFFSVPSGLSYEDAENWMTNNGFESKESCFYHLPYKFNDLYFRGAKAVWGVSPMAFKAKVKGMNEVGGDIGGWHKSPAGEVRGVIERSGAEVLPNAGEPNFKNMVKVRLNKIVPNSKGKLCIDDALTCTSAENYLKYQHVTSTFNAISRRFNAGVQTLKHEDDGIVFEGLEQLMKAIGDDFVSTGGLVKPRVPEDGDKEFVFEIEQKGIDLWHVRWWGCPTGSARRIAGFPIVVK